jgi:lysophospholipase L1-like esterase
MSARVSRRSLLALVSAAVAAAPASAVASARRGPWRVLAYGASNSWGFLPLAPGAPLRRLTFAQRWTGQAQRQLGSNYVVVEDTLPGRTAGADRPGFGVLAPSAMNGLKELPEALLRNLPLDLVVLQLGTNDLMLDPEIAPEAFAARIGALADAIGAFRFPIALEGQTYPIRTLVMAPTAIGDTPGNPAGLRAEAARRRCLPALRALGLARGFSVFDGAEAVPAPGPDGLHFDAQAHRRLGVLAARAIREALA